MTTVFKLRCPDCLGKFPWDNDLPEPRVCPLCRSDLGEPKDDNVVCLPAFLSNKTKGTDALYTQLEKGSEFRAEKAAELAGCSPSEMAGMKITNLQTGLREGDVAAQKVENPVSQFMDQNPQAGGFKGTDGVGYSGAVQAGAFANMGAKTRTMLQEHHGRITGGNAVSDRPGLETAAPTYRRRG